MTGGQVEDDRTKRHDKQRHTCVIADVVPGDVTLRSAVHLAHLLMSSLRHHLSSCIRHKLDGDDVAYTRTLQTQKHKSRRHPRLRLRLETIAPPLLQPSPAT
ncbi:hypothetical protein C0Q70_16478 [Pomacea canaliculata]|uniref:Uncharacterized protein n=1 Tax=Pomacea canaliculata TaxID=400727 RepID=A0A2T7NPW6_POMCA|nr:hypothetical protein C0Q70_16478 [Pomacea canaliculata]